MSDVTTLFFNEQNEVFACYKKWLLSDEKFPVDIDDLQLYSKKYNTKRLLLSTFKENIDWISLHEDTTRKHGGQNKETIRISIPCLKELLMMQRSAEGKKIRRYFIFVEDLIRHQLRNEVKDLHDLLYSYDNYKSFISDLKQKEAEKKKEKYYQNLTENLYGEILLSRQTEHGEIDVHLSDKIIELKHWRSYKSALGQLLAYGNNNDKNLFVVFFGPIPSQEKLKSVEDLFTTYNIQISYFDEDDILINPP